MCIFMATKNISISVEAYNRLAKLKKENESFTELVSRITRKSRLNDFFGIWSKEQADEIEENIKYLRENHKKNRLKRIEKISREFE